MSKTRKDSTISELEDRLKEVTTTNQKYRKQLLDRESELQVSFNILFYYFDFVNFVLFFFQMYLRRLGDDELGNTQEIMISRLHIPRQDVVIKKEG